MKMLAPLDQEVAEAPSGATEALHGASNRAANTQSQLQIGEWRADRPTNALERAGETVRVEPKVMEVLMVLADHASHVVSRQKLLDAVWPGVIVGDEALTQSIIKLRRALGDNPRSPSYIETISKRGYRLIAPVGKIDPLPPMLHESRMAEPAETPAHLSRPVRLVGLIAGLVFIATLALVAIFNSMLERPRPVVTSADPLLGAADGQRALLTVTILPFETVGAGAEQNYLAQGMSNDLMTDLSRLSGLRLISAASGRPDGSRERTARYVISGSVQRYAASLRINVRLIDSQTKEQIWSERFDRPFGDLFAIQDEISRSLAEFLPTKISDAERWHLAKRYTNSLQAYDLFLRAQALFLVRRADENQQARAFYLRAVELDPKFARAYAGLAMTYAMDYRYHASAETATALDRARELAQTARLIDPDLPEVYWALGFVHTPDRRQDEAIKALQKAIQLNRSYADAYALLGGIYTYVGEPAKSIPLVRTALRLNPDGGYLYFLILGRAYLFENDTDQALINLREAFARNADDLETRVYLAAALAAHGDRFEAESEVDEIRLNEKGFSTRRWLDSYPMTSTRHQKRLVALLAMVGL